MWFGFQQPFVGRSHAVQNKERLHRRLYLIILVEFLVCLWFFYILLSFFSFMACKSSDSSVNVEKILQEERHIPGTSYLNRLSNVRKLCSNGGFLVEEEKYRVTEQN